jgi:hypothetical protein
MNLSNAGPADPARLVSALGSICMAAVTLWLALRHPLVPGTATIACCAWALTSFMRPGWWLLAVPATLPLLNFSPWTGWLIFDEFDLLIMATLAGGQARMAFIAPTPRATAERDAVWRCKEYGALLMLGVMGVVGLLKGLGETDALALGLFGGYDGPANSVRTVKPLLYSVLLLPLLRRELRDPESSARAMKRFANGSLVGLGVVALAVCWERAAFPGFLNFTSPYRSVGMFWEMHVGGAALDAYLVLTVPFVVWALWSATSWTRWIAAAFLALLAEYACLTTYSRGVYLAVVASLVLLAFLLNRQRRDHSCDAKAPHRIRVRASVLAALMLLEALLVVGSGSFMVGRLGASERDLRGRLAHWQDGLGLLHSPGDWALGLGLGRLPADYAAAVAGGEFPGSVQLYTDPGNSYVSIAGPRSVRTLGGLYGLTQRLPTGASDSRLFSLDVRATRATRLRLSKCEIHLLYERLCQAAVAEVRPTETRWHTISVDLVGTRLSAGPWYAPRSQVLTISVLDDDASIDVDNLSLKGDDRIEQVRNGGFSRGLARWFPVAKNHFLPWHVDNLYLEVLIERGVLGLAAFLMVVVCALRRLAFGMSAGERMAPFLAASLTGALTVGLVCSVLDVPRVAFLFFLVLLIAICTRTSREE